MATRYHQGKFKPRNPQKYLGDSSDITFRSSWEKKVMNHFDTSSGVIAWNSESVVIPYVSPKDNKYHRYYMDFLIVTRGKNGEKITTLIEVKPKKQTVPPVKRGKRKSRYLYEAMTYEVNIKKWAAARAYCKVKGWNFIIMTEDHVF
jgi:hypothetical protein